MIAFDGTENKSKLGANATLAVSLAALMQQQLNKNFHCSNTLLTYVVKLL